MRVETEQAEFEAALAVLRAVAGPLIAAQPREDRLHLLGEVDRDIGGHLLDADRDDRLCAGGLDGERRLAVTGALHQAGRRHGGGLTGDGVLGIAAEIPHPPVGVDAQDTDALLVAWPTKVDLGRVDDQVGGRSLRRVGVGAGGQNQGD